MIVYNIIFLLILNVHRLILCSNYNYANEFYEISRRKNENITSKDSKKFVLIKVHLIRIPKASSTSLSVIARRIVGCNPPGPCCRFPGEPKGTCPSKELYSCQVPLNKVIGCTNHHPNYGTLMTMDIPTISIMREPYSRSISAFFYPGIHHNSNCKVSQKQCYLQYTSNLKWQNIGVKLLTGLYAYSNVNICQYIKDCRHSLELALLNLDRYIYFMGIAEMWELSILILHHKFPKFTPQLSDFLLSGNNNNSTNRYDNTSGILFDDYNKELLKKQEIRENLKASSNKYSSKSNNKKRLLSYFNASHSKNNNNHNNSILYDKNRYLLLSDTTASYRSNNDEDYKQFKSSAYEKYSKQLFQQNSFDVIIYRRAIYNMCKELHYFNLWDLNIIKSYWELRTPYYVSLCS